MGIVSAAVDEYTPSNRDSIQPIKRFRKPQDSLFIDRRCNCDCVARLYKLHEFINGPVYKKGEGRKSAKDTGTGQGCAGNRLFF